MKQFGLILNKREAQEYVGKIDLSALELIPLERDPDSSGRFYSEPVYFKKDLKKAVKKWRKKKIKQQKERVQAVFDTSKDLAFTEDRFKSLLSDLTNSL